MVKVRVFGLLRIDTGLKEFSTDAASVKDLYPKVLDEAKKLNPETEVTAADVSNCIAVVNGKPAKGRSRLKDGDEVVFMSPVCGG